MCVTVEGDCMCVTVEGDCMCVTLVCAVPWKEAVCEVAWRETGYGVASRKLLPRCLGAYCFVAYGGVLLLCSICRRSTAL